MTILGLFGALAGAITRSADPAPNTADANAASERGWGSLGGYSSAAGVRVNQQAAMAVSAVHACVTIRSEDVARCRPTLYAAKPDGGRVAVTDHPVARLLKRPNTVQTWFEFMEQMQAGYLLRGNAYAVILRNRRGDPTALLPIHPDQVLMLETYSGALFYQVSRLGLFQTAMLAGLPNAIAAEDMLHLRGMSFGTLIGASRLSYASDAVGLGIAQQTQAGRWLRNGARPSGVLQCEKPLTDAAALRLKAGWDAFKRGIDNAGETVILEEGLKYQSIQLTSVDLEFLASRNFTVADIGRFFRTPLFKLGVADGGSKGATPAQQDQSYVNDVIMPDLDRWEQKLAQALDLDAEGLTINLDEEQLLRGDMLTRFNAYRVGILTGFMAPNAAREKEGWDPVEGGDEVFRPLNMAALGSDAAGAAPDGAGRPAAGEVPLQVAGAADDKPAG